MIEHIETEYSEITPQIFIGTNLCNEHNDCSRIVSELLSKEIDVDIDLEEERMDAPTNKIKVFLWLPTLDQMPPTQEQLYSGTHLMEALIKVGKKVYVHCRLGHGRAPTLVAAYFIHLGKGVNEAIEIVKGRRPEIHLVESQIEALEKFKEFHERNSQNPQS